MPNENLSAVTQQRLAVVDGLKQKAGEASTTLNPMAAKRLAGEIISVSVEMIEQLIISIGKLEARINETGNL